MSSRNSRPRGPRKPEAIADILKTTLRSHRIDKKLEQYSAFPYWKELVGEEIAKVAKPEKITRGKILVVRVVDAVWAQELALQKIQFLDKLRELNIGATIEDIRFITGNPDSIKTK